MTLNMIWFILIAVLYTGFFVLEGFDFGVGMLLPFLGKKDEERRMIINTIGPHWDSNEVWLITAGGATFAAFPHWYATMFSGFYLPLFLLLVALILRGVAFEFRSKDDNPTWRSFWDWAIAGGSLVAALLLGVAFSNLIRGVPINADMIYTGGFWYLLNPFALLGGATAVVTFILEGAIFLSLKTSGNVLARTKAFANKLWIITLVLYVIFTVATYLSTDILMRFGINPGIVPIMAGVLFLLSGLFLRREREGWAFTMIVLAITFTLATFFWAMFPRVMVATVPANSLDIFNAASSEYTLRTMTIIALIFTPVMLAYQGWSYWTFRRRLTTDPKHLEY
ncbi:MAG: cytochrome d ubiquinol oxidase subunit II [Anaerolineales bacterium]|nr:cytochrome d ubiquinol oxidase subunit II [Anaerolineales bacterium]